MKIYSEKSITLYKERLDVGETGHHTKLQRRQRSLIIKQKAGFVSIKHAGERFTKAIHSQHDHAQP